MKGEKFDFIVVGAGIFGLSTAYSLNKRGYSVCILSDGIIPSPQASSYDMSKIIRLEYGSDLEYLEMAERSLRQWREWNSLLASKTFHETGFLLLCKSPIDDPLQNFESGSSSLLESKGYQTQKIDSSIIADSYPAFCSSTFVDGFYNPIGGFVESARVIELLSRYLQQKGVVIHDKSKVVSMESSTNRVNALLLDNNQSFHAGSFIYCTGCYTPQLLDMMDSFTVTGHPSFHLKCPDHLSAKFSADRFPVFSADISNTGWYGFPIHPKSGLIKIARHGVGIPIDPLSDPRSTTKKQAADLRAFLKQCIPDLAKAELVSSRICCYTDTADGHFWIDQHQSKTNLVVASGGSGHGFKMGPELGEMIALTALGESHTYSDRYRARVFTEETVQEEQARK